MARFRIVSNAGVDLGTYKANNVAGALDAMARQAGYRDADDAAEQCGAFEGQIEEIKMKTKPMQMTEDFARAYLARRRDERRMAAGWTKEEREANLVPFNVEMLAVRDCELDRLLDERPAKKEEK
jgi:hypothetical protein